MAERRKRLIEVAFPLEEVSEHSRREKNVRHGHISTLHIWWARRPLAACRAFIYASLVDDPDNDKDREQLLKEVADLASWDAVRKPDAVVRPTEKGGSGLTGRQLLERARQRILDCNGGKPPRLLDPFAGGGAIPLEALRLGCEVEASDLNPVAVLILKCTAEYPQKYGQASSREVPGYIREAAADGVQKGFFEGDLLSAYETNPLATDVRYWGNWMLEHAREELAKFYPANPDGSVPVAYLWSRTVPCPNCGAEMPLIRQYWLARKDKHKVALSPVIDRANNRVDFDIVQGDNITDDPGEATASLGDSLCLSCRQVLKGQYIRQAAKAGHMDAVMTAIVSASIGQLGKTYRPPREEDREHFYAAKQRLHQVIEMTQDDQISLVPDEPMPSRAETTGGVVSAFGLDTYGKLFNSRQLLALTTFSRLVRESYDEMLAHGMARDYALAVVTYLGLAVDRLADRASTLCRWDAASSGGTGAIMGTFGRQALPMVWDYAEVNPFSRMTGDFTSALDWVCGYLDSGPAFDGEASVIVRQEDARHSRSTPSGYIIADPPYYDAINYSNLSDFFYVWLKRSLGFLHTDLLLLPLTPKKDQIVANVYAYDGSNEESKRQAAHRRYVDGMAEAFKAMRVSLINGGVVGIVFAHTDPSAWSTLIEGLLDAELIPDASWPIDTELENKVSRIGQARLSTSVWMACRPRHDEAGEAFLGDVLSEMRPVINERLLYFWGKGIRGADFFISAIGPALSVFGRYEKVMRPDGSEVTVRDFLDLVRRESTTVALEQVLGGADLGVVDPVTRQYVTWVWSHSRAPLDAGEAIALCLATGADYGQTVRPHAIAVEAKEKSKKVVKLRTIRERGQQDDDLGVESAARVTPLIDQLQRAAFLWSQNKQDEIAKYRSALGETRWQALRTLGQAVAECLPDGDEDRRLINGLMSSNAVSSAPRAAQPINQQAGLGI
jgi:adenine-specific DNA methylase